MEFARISAIENKPVAIVAGSQVVDFAVSVFNSHRVVVSSISLYGVFWPIFIELNGNFISAVD